MVGDQLKQRAVNVLVVDDDPRIVKTTCDILKIKGYHPIAAFSGEEGLKSVKNTMPDCVLMDIKMPGINGVAAMKQMHKINPALPVVLISAHADDELLDDAKRSGAYVILGKPLNFQLILTLLGLCIVGESILVVDDDPDFCNMLRDVLSLRGVHVETEKVPEKLLDGDETDHWLMAILDLKLASANGLGVLQHLQAKFPFLPIVLVTNDHQKMSDPIRKAFEFGIHACLYKPIDIEALFKVITEIRLKRVESLSNTLPVS